MHERDSLHQCRTYQSQQKAKTPAAEILMMLKEIDESLNSEQFKTIYELQEKNASLWRLLPSTLKKDFDYTKMTRNWSESMVTRLQQQISEMRGTVNSSQDAADFKDPEPASSKVSGQTFTSGSRNHVSGDNCFKPQSFEFQKP